MSISIQQLVERNPATVVGVIVAAVVFVAFVGCAPTQTSPITGEVVTEAKFDAEVVAAKADIESRVAALEAEAKALAAQTEAAHAEFDRSNAAITGVLDIVGGLAVTAAGPYGPAATAGLAILAGALGVDNRRKDGVIRGQKQFTDRIVDSDGGGK